MTIYCDWENASFPKSDFYQDDEGRWIHRDRLPLHTKEGMKLHPIPWSGLPELTKRLLPEEFGDETLA